MAQFMLLMHNDYDMEGRSENWQQYLDGLASAGVLRGGSAMGAGVCMRRAADAPANTRHLVGYVKLEVRDLGHARECVHGNPVYEAGGTVEIRELPETE